MATGRSSPVMRGALCAIVAASVTVFAGDQQSSSPVPQPPPEAEPTFRSAINAVVVDARVLDQDGGFIRDLTRDDFRLFEDGLEQRIDLFRLVDLPFDGPLPPVFDGRRVERDVASNGLPLDGRLYVLVLDDVPGAMSPIAMPYVRAAAREFVEHYVSDHDLVALITTSGRPDMVQPFTGNRQRLLAAIDRYVPGYGQEIFVTTPRPRPLDTARAPATRRFDTLGGYSGGYDNDHTTMLSLRALAQWLAGVRGRRKAIITIGSGTGCFSEHAFLGPQQADDTRQLLDASADGTVTIYNISPANLDRQTAALDWFAAFDVSDRSDRDFRPFAPLTRYDVNWGRGTTCTQGLGLVARDTGGFSLPASPEAFARIATESSSYYLLAYTSTNKKQDKKAFRRVELQTTRPGLKVVSRSGYVADDPKARKIGSWSGVPPILNDIIHSPVPVPGFMMHVAAPIFREGSGSKASVGVVLEARASQLRLVERDRRFTGAFSVFVVATDIDGKAKDRESGTFSLRMTSEDRAQVVEHGARLVTKLALKPGRYQLRVNTLEIGDGVRGSVHYDLDVPDLTKGPLAMSSIALLSRNKARTPTAGTDDRWKKFAGVPPTVERDFADDDDLQHYVEVYDNSKKGGSIEITTTILDEQGRATFSARDSKKPIREKAPVYRFVSPVPLGELAPGQYLLKVEARTSAVRDAVVSREIPFAVHPR